MLLFLKIMLTEFIAEMGDKTQLMLIAMTSKYKIRDIVIGTAVAVLVLNGLAVLAGGLVGSLVPAWLIKLIAAAAFLYFAASSLKKEDDEEEETAKSRFHFAPLSVFLTFFVAELGDKTQLTAMTFGANEGLNSALIVWLACSVGLFAADMLGMAVGYLLKTKIPDGFLTTLAFVIFSVFGILTVYQGMELLVPGNQALMIGVTIAVAVVFALVCAWIWKKEKAVQS